MASVVIALQMMVIFMRSGCSDGNGDDDSYNTGDV